MSQKSSVPQAVSFVSQVLKRDKVPAYPHPGNEEGSGDSNNRTAVTDVRRLGHWFPFPMTRKAYT